MSNKRNLLADTIFFLSRHLSLREFIALAKLISLVYYNLNITSRSIVKNNMKSMHMKFSIKQYLNFAQFLSENVYLFNNEINLSRFAFHNLDVIEEAVKSGKRVFLITVHYGNWEMAGQSMQKLGYNLSVIFEKKTNWIYEYIDKIRTKYGLKLIEKHASAEDIKKEADSGRIISFLIDHKSTNIALKQMKFLGIDTELPYGWYKLIKRLDAVPVCVLTRYENHKHHVYFFNSEDFSFDDYYIQFEKMIKKDIYQYDFYNQMWKDISF